MEDLSTYFEIDSNAKVTVTSSAVSISGATDNTLYSLYKDKGANFFDALDIDFAIVQNNTVSTDSALGFSLNNNSSPSTYTIGATSSDALNIVAYWYANQRLYLTKDWVNGGGIYYGTTGTKVYCTLTRPAGGDTVTLKVYSNSARTTLIDTLTVSGFSGIKWRYIHALCTTHWSENNALNGEISDITIRGVEEPTYAGFLLSAV
jgi:hypothetical protein